MPEKELTKLKRIYEDIIESKIDENGFLDGNLIEKFNIDSLIALQIIVEIEKRFDIIIEDDEKAIKMVDSPSFFLNIHQKVDKNEQSCF